MALSREAYQALEDIVGPDNISDDPSLCDSYAFQYLAETARPDQSHFMPRPVAVLMPGSTEEVQAIVKTCNRHKIKVKPYSTGWYFFGAPQKEGDDTIQLDLRLMDRILDIDEKNMFAVVEPYVICATLQAEVMKVGLNLNIIGAGASTSPLGNATSYLGSGPSTPWMGHNSDNLLGLEWVMPTGDILRTGSLGSGVGWFCGEGPGPSLRGLCRGVRGARGGMGVYTKAALKLTHWPGPPQLPIEGRTPGYRSPMPDNFRAYTLAFPSWPAYAEAYYKIYDNEIGYIFHRQFTMLGADLGPAFWILYIDPTKTLSNIEEIAKKPEVQKLTEEMRRSFQLILAGCSLRDIEFQDRVLDQILAETGGWKVDRMAEPDMAEFTYLYMIRWGHKALNFVYTGAYLGSWAQKGTPDTMIQYQPLAEAGAARDQKSGLLVQCGGDSMMGPGSSVGGGGACGFEQFIHYDPSDKESVKAAIKHMLDAKKDAHEHGLPSGKEDLYLKIAMTDEQLHQQYANSSQPIVFHLQRKIKELLDPNDIGDRLYTWLPDKEVVSEIL
jgi:glycolate oxidase